MTCVQSTLPVFSYHDMNREQALHVGDKPTFHHPNMLEDIRFTFSIWHQPNAQREVRVQGSDIEARARTKSRLARATAPFTWLPLLPIETTIETEQRRQDYVVPTGLSLVPPMSDDIHLPATPSLVRRASAVIGDVQADTPSSRKKQRMTSEERDLEDVERSMGQRHVAPDVERNRKEVTGMRIQRVRMRDVDVVEDFLDQFLPEFGTGVSLRILLNTPGVSALAVQAIPHDQDIENDAQEGFSTDMLDPTQPILALVVYRKTRFNKEQVTTHMQAIAVHPSSRRLGLGQRLVREALEDSRHEVQSVVAPRIRLKAEGYDGNGSREFWQRCIAGLRVSSRRIGFRRGWIGEAQL